MVEHSGGENGGEGDARDDALDQAAAAYWRLWIANWTPPFEVDPPLAGGGSEMAPAPAPSHAAASAAQAPDA